IMLHQREDRRSVRFIRDRTAALPVVPAHVELVHEHAIGDVLRRHNAFVRVALQKELPAMEVPMVVDFETHDFWRGVAHRDDARAVRAGRERDRDRGNLDARAGARPNLSSTAASRSWRSTGKAKTGK